MLAGFLSSPLLLPLLLDGSNVDLYIFFFVDFMVDQPIDDNENIFFVRI